MICRGRPEGGVRVSVAHFSPLQPKLGLSFLVMCYHYFVRQHLQETSLLVLILVQYSKGICSELVNKIIRREWGGVT